MGHEILRKKLSWYGKRGAALKWFESYLADKVHEISLNGHKLQLCTKKTAVPLGSIVGPLLFLIFLNDFQKCSIFLKFTLFAADSTLIYSLKNMSIESISDSKNDNLETFNYWMNVNKI